MISSSCFNFDRYTTIESLSNSLRCSSQTFNTSKQLFKQHQIPKKNRKKGFRRVWEIKSFPLKELLRTLNLEYTKFVCAKIPEFPLPCVHGFIDNRSTLTNAKPHTGKSILLKCDISSFFESISVIAIEEHFIKMNLDPNIANILSSLLTIDGYLPQGYCTSPLMSNLVFFDLDQKLMALATKYNCIYTRYADDITFSSNKEVPTFEEISNILAEKKFKLDLTKSVLKKIGQAFYVTGLSVSTSIPRAPKKWKRELRQEIHYIEKYGISGHVGRKNYPSIQFCINKLTGKIRYLNSIEPLLSMELKKKLENQMLIEGRSLNYFEREKAGQHFIGYIDECKIGNALFMCMVLIEDSIFIEDQLKTFLQNLLQDEFIPQTKGVLEKGYFHWCELSITLREKLAEKISCFPFQAFISCSKIEYNDANYKEVFVKLFNDLLKARYSSLDGHHLKICVENNSVASESFLQKLSDEIYDNLEKNGYRRPLSKPSISSLKKDAMLILSLPDSVLGALNRYFRLDISCDELKAEEAIFKRLNTKINLINVLSINNAPILFKGKKRFIARGISLIPYLNNFIK